MDENKLAPRDDVKAQADFDAEKASISDKPEVTRETLEFFYKFIETRGLAVEYMLVKSGHLAL